MTLLEEFITQVGDERYFVKDHPASYQELINLLVARKTNSFFQDNTIQCDGGRRRSLIDIARIVLFHFPETPVEEIVRYVALGMKTGRMYSFYCPNIKRQVIMNYDGSDPGGFIYDENNNPETLGYRISTRDLIELYQNE